MRIFLVVTNQTSISAFECQRLMRRVNEFRKTAAEGWDGGRPLQVLVTGRSAFVSEISLSMRYDVVATLLASVVLVGTIFFVGFRRWLPLLGMALCLLLSCLVALTAGQLLFGRLSMISVGFCAILVGLGVDFAILTIGRYHQARADGEPHQQAIATSVAKLGRAVFFGALTTAVGFLALVLSGAMSFSQLGVLIAIGIFVASLFMCSILFLFVRDGRRSTDILSVGPAGSLPAGDANSHSGEPINPKPAGETPTGPTGKMPVPQSDWLFELVRKYVRSTVRKPAPVLIVSGAVLLLLTALGFSPVPPLQFEASTRSLQPKNIRASQALDTIMNKMPVRWEPVLAIVRATNSQELHEYWQKLSAHWREAAGSWQNQGVLHACGALSVTDLDGTKPQSFTRDQFSGGARRLEPNSRGRGIQRRRIRPSVCIARRFATRGRSERAIAELAYAIAGIIQLVVFDRPLLWARPVVNDWICHDEPKAGNPRTKPGTGTRSAGGERPDHSDRLDVCARRSPVVVSLSIAPDQCTNGNVRPIAAGHFVSGSSALANPGDYTRVRDRSDDRLDETTEYPFEFTQCAFVSSGTGYWRGLRNLCRVGLAKNA